MVPEQDREEMARRYRAGESLSEIARAMRPCGGPRPRLAYEDLRLTHDLRVAGLTLREIGARLGISEASVSERLAKCEIGRS